MPLGGRPAIKGIPGATGAAGAAGAAGTTGMSYPGTTTPSYGATIPAFPLTSLASRTTTNPTLGEIQAVPFMLGLSLTLDRLSIQVISAAAGSVIRLGIYSAHATGRHPTSLLYGSPEISGATTGVKSVTGIALALTGGVLYWASWLLGVASPVLVTQDSGGGVGLGKSRSMFFESIIGFNDDALDNHYDYIGKAQAYGVMPDPFPATVVVRLVGAGGPRIYGRV